MSKYYGSNKIVKSKKLGAHYHVKYKDGDTEIMTKALYKVGVTNEPSDLTTLRDKRMEPVIKDMMQVMLDYDIKPFEPMNELDYILSGIKTSYNSNFQKADERKWGISADKLKFSDIDKCLK